MEKNSERSGQMCYRWKSSTWIERLVPPGGTATKRGRLDLGRGTC